MYRRRDGSARYAPRWTLRMQIHEPELEVCLRNRVGRRGGQLPLVPDGHTIRTGSTRQLRIRAHGDLLGGRPTATPLD